MLVSVELLALCQNRYSMISNKIATALAVMGIATFTVSPVLASEDVASSSVNPAITSAASANASDDFRLGRDEKKEISELGRSDVKFRALHSTWGAKSTVKPASLSIPSIDPVSKVDISSYYGYRTDPFRGRRKNHKGIDIRGPVGTPIFATADGFVKTAKWFSSYGRFIELDHGNAIKTRYGHMSRLNVKANQYVKKGDVIGFMGSTGRSTGSHLHYEVRIGGEPVNPQSFMAYQNDSRVKITDKSTEKNVARGGPAQ